jgi:hypothetical protein
MGALPGQLAQAAREIGESIPQILARSRLRLEPARKRELFIDEADPWMFSVRATNYIEGVSVLHLLDPGFELGEESPLLEPAIEHAIERSRSIPRGLDEAKLGVLGNLLDATASSAMLLEGQGSPRAKRLFEAGLRVRQGEETSPRSWKPGQDEDDVCRALLRLNRLGRHEDVLFAFEHHLRKDTGVFHVEPEVQMAVTCYLNSATRCERGKSVENAEFGSRVWRDLTVFWWLAAKSRVEYSLQGYHLYALLAAAGDGAGSRPLIVVDELFDRMTRTATRFFK